MAKGPVRETFDYVIVGAGSAGCVLAERLSALAGVSVALVEAGAGSRGGSGRYRYGAAGPVPAENLRDPSPATEAFLRACAELGLSGGADLNAPDHTGYGAVPVTQHRGRPTSAADAYLRAALRRPGLRVLTGVRVVRVALIGDRAVGIEGVGRRGESVKLVARREVILCAGAVGSPQLLMLSGIGDPRHLSEHGIDVQVPLAGVGRGLQDHLAAALVVPRPWPITLGPRARSVRGVGEYLLRRRGPLASNLCEAAAFVHSRPGLSAPDLELGFLPAAYAPGEAPRRRGHAVTIAAVLLQPKSRGRVMLRDGEASSAPLVDPGYLTDPAGQDLRTLMDGLRVAARLLSTGALSPFADMQRAELPDLEDDASLARFVRAHADTAHHPVGSCRMGSDEFSVVDGELRVHGVDALRVVDASVMPTITRGHAQAPTIAIAERAADLIAGSTAFTHELLRARSGGGRAGMDVEMEIEHSEVEVGERVD